MSEILKNSGNVIFRKKAKATLKTNSKDKLFDAITKATALLVQSDYFNDNIDKALGIICNAAKIDRINIFEQNIESQKNRTSFSLVYEWTADSRIKKQESSDSNHLFFETETSGLLDKLSRGKIYSGITADLSKPYEDVSEAMEVKSFLWVPIFIGKNLWGFVGFNDCTNIREWTVDEERLLSAVAGTIGTVFLRKKEHEELIKAKERAEESDKLKSAFLANMNHEIRTPMNNIIGFISLLEDPDLTSETKNEYMNVIKKSGERLLNTICRIIDLSKIESGQTQVCMDDLNLIEFLDSLYTSFKQKVEAKGLTLNRVFRVSEEQAFIKTDRNKLYTIMFNLIENALKYTKSGYVEYGCSIEADLVQFYVKDSGIGISECKRKIIFSSFVQADVSRSRSYEGSGLGLSISKAYIEMLGGKIWVNSKENVGSIFSFHIPVDFTETEHYSPINRDIAFS
jgi:signal transduction histidine kinase